MKLERSIAAPLRRGENRLTDKRGLELIKKMKSKTDNNEPPSIPSFKGDRDSSREQRVRNVKPSQSFGCAKKDNLIKFMEL